MHTASAEWLARVADWNRAEAAKTAGKAREQGTVNSEHVMEKEES